MIVMYCSVWWIVAADWPAPLWFPIFHSDLIGLSLGAGPAPLFQVGIESKWLLLMDEPGHSMNDLVDVNRLRYVMGVPGQKPVGADIRRGEWRLPHLMD